MSSKRILFCDFFGVLSYDKFWNTLNNPDHKYYKYYSNIIDYLFNENREIANDWMRGEYTIEQIHRLLNKKIGVPYGSVLKIFKDDCKSLDVSKKLLGKIQSLQEKYYRILVTDNMDTFNRYTLPSNPALNLAFDKIINSYDSGYLKSSENGKIFQDTCNNLGYNLTNSCLIDDSKNTCDIFSNLGGKSYCVSGVNNVDKVLDNL